MQIGSYELRFVSSRQETQPHRRATIATIAVSRGGEALGTLEPRMNHYRGQMSPIGTPAVRTALLEDLYLSVMTIDPKGAYVGLKAYVNPAILWIWIAAGIMVLGSVVAAWPSRAEERATVTLASDEVPA